MEGSSGAGRRSSVVGDDEGISQVLQAIESEKGIVTKADSNADPDEDEGGFVKSFMFNRRRLIGMLQPMGKKKRAFTGSVVFDFCAHNMSQEYCPECKHIAERAERLERVAGKYCKMVKMGLPAEQVLLDMCVKKEVDNPVLQDFADHFCEGRQPDLNVKKANGGASEDDKGREQERNPRSAVALKKMHWQTLDKEKAKGSVFAASVSMKTGGQMTMRELQVVQDALAKDVPTAGAAAGSKSGTTPPHGALRNKKDANKMKRMEVLNAHRVQNAGICLAQFRDLRQLALGHNGAGAGNKPSMLELSSATKSLYIVDKIGMERRGPPNTQMATKIEDRDRDGVAAAAAEREESAVPTEDDGAAWEQAQAIERCQRFANEIVRALVDADGDKLPASKLLTLCSLLPSTDEAEKLKKIRLTSGQGLSDIESVMRALSVHAQQRLPRKVKALLFRSQLEEQLAIVTESMALLLEACTQVVTSTRLAKLFDVSCGSAPPPHPTPPSHHRQHFCADHLCMRFPSSLLPISRASLDN
jgi:hypothetical protein